ncbi:MAG: hydroxyacid dehydrogenase [Anaerolineaceae bacterium]|nr:hydroxyacid dehydrogenase [Anaerolineaceae bacterium]
MKRHQGIFVLNEGLLDRVYPAPFREELAAWVDFLNGPKTARDLEADPDLLREVDVIFGSWGMPNLSAELLAHSPNLKAVFYAAGSIRYFTSEAFWGRGIRVCSAYQVNGEFVANFTIAQILLSLKQYWAAVQRYQEYRNTWEARTEPAGQYGSTVGLISLGAIGQQVARMLQPFGLNVIAHDPFWTPERAAALGVRLCDLDQVFAQADVVSLHTPWLPETEGMIRGAHLRSMKPSSTFINTARGAVVNEGEMVDVLEERPDLFALLDVTYPEPPEAESKLFSLPNVVLTPHIAGAMGGEVAKMGRLMVDEYLRFKDGQPLEAEISEERSKLLA